MVLSLGYTLTAVCTLWVRERGRRCSSTTGSTSPPSPRGRRPASGWLCWIWTLGCWTFSRYLLLLTPSNYSLTSPSLAPPPGPARPRAPPRHPQPSPPHPGLQSSSPHTQGKTNNHPASTYSSQSRLSWSPSLLHLGCPWHSWPCPGVTISSRSSTPSTRGGGR